VSTERVVLSFQEDDRRRLGALIYRGGLVLRSADKRFGGLSGLILSPDCTAFRAVSDHGFWFTGRLLYDAERNLVGIADTYIEKMINEKGDQLRRKRQRDAESLALTPGGDTVVSFEGNNALRLYRRGEQLPRRLVAPLHKGDGPKNAGIEALTALADGGLLAITEDFEGGRGAKAWIGGIDKPWRTAVFHIDGGFRPTGAATLPDGDVVVLERRVLPPAARLRRLRQEDILRDAELLGDVWAHFDGALTYDNMEAIDACTTGGETRLLLASDDNYNWFQRTLFMMFALPR
jgi:hypothetical protein